MALPTTPGVEDTTAARVVAPSARQPPSVHVRAVITWLAIFPLVAIGMLLMGPISADSHPAARAFVLTLIVVPLAVYLVVPQVFRAYGAIRGRKPR